MPVPCAAAFFARALDRRARRLGFQKLGAGIVKSNIRTGPCIPLRLLIKVKIDFLSYEKKQEVGNGCESLDPTRKARRLARNPTPWRDFAMRICSRGHADADAWDANAGRDRAPSTTLPFGVASAAAASPASPTRAQARSARSWPPPRLWAVSSFAGTQPRIAVVFLPRGLLARPNCPHPRANCRSTQSGPDDFSSFREPGRHERKAKDAAGPCLRAVHQGERRCGGAALSPLQERHHIGRGSFLK